MFGSMGGVEVLIILVIGIVVFGVIKLPKIARMLGSGMSGYNKLKKGFSFGDIMDTLKGGDGEQDREPSRKQQPPPGWQPQGPPPQWHQHYPPQEGGPNQDETGNRGNG